MKHRLTKLQREILEELARPCGIDGWRYGPSSHPYWDTATYKSLIRRSLIERDDVTTKTREGWLFTAHLCKITQAGRDAVGILIMREQRP